MDIKEFLLIQDLKKQYLEQYKNSIQRGSYDYYLYHDQNNEDTILWSIILSPVLFLFSSSCMGGIFIVSGVWVFCALCCFIRNKAMDLNADIIYKRDICFRKYLEDKNLIKQTGCDKNE